MIEFEAGFYPARQFIIHEGKLYARVTSTLQSFTNFGGISKDVLEAKAALGTRVHECINELIEGKSPTALGNEIGYVKSFENWRAEINPTFLETETRYYCDKYRITGQIDALVKIEGKEEAVLVDFKTSVQESPIVWPMQGHLYHYLLAEANKVMAPFVLFIKLDRYGNKPKVFKYEVNTNQMEQCFKAVGTFWKPYDMLS